MSSDKENAAKEVADKQARKEALAKYKKRADPTTVEELLGADEVSQEYLGDASKWRAAWASVEFDDDACLKNVTTAGKTKDGYFAPAGRCAIGANGASTVLKCSMLPLGASLPDMTVLKYGGYFPSGTSFPGGVLIPLHARMVNLLPQETIEAPKKLEEGLCCVQ